MALCEHDAVDVEQDSPRTKGHMPVRDLFGTGETVQARVECLAMDGQTAVIGAEPTKVPEFGAQSIFIVVLDHGDDDLVTAVATIDPVDPDSCLSVLSFATQTSQSKEKSSSVTLRRTP